MSYNPENQYRCTIIRGKSQTEMEDMLPFYAQMVHANCPCTKDEFQTRCCGNISQLLFGTDDFVHLPSNNKKTVRNHVTEIAGKLLGLYYEDIDGYVNETESCALINDTNDYPLFFKNLCANLQFPNGSQKINTIEERILNMIHIKPLCFVVALLDHARKNGNKLLTKQEIGYYALNSLEVLQGKVPIKDVFGRIMSDRENNVKIDKLSGSFDWQHIKEQFNLLDLSNITLSDSEYIWLNNEEEPAIAIFIEKNKEPLLDITSYNLKNKKGKLEMYAAWGKYYGQVDVRFIKLTNGVDVTKPEAHVREHGAVGLSTIQLGDLGENLVYNLECERVRKYKKRLVNKVILLGKTKGLGYDICSIEADENPHKPEYARYIEVKSTKRTTEPSFKSETWYDTLNLTSKEWIAAEQYGDYYNIYRVYFTKSKTIIIRIQNPYRLSQEGKIEVFPTNFLMNFNGDIIKIQYEQTV